MNQLGRMTVADGACERKIVTGMRPQPIKVSYINMYTRYLVVRYDRYIS